MKLNRKLLILSSLVFLLPITFGFLVWDKLPDQIPSHFNFAGDPDAYSAKMDVVLYLPLILFGVHVFSLFMLSKDPKRAQVSPKLLGYLYWLTPCLTLFLLIGLYSYVFSLITNPSRYILLGISFVFILLGNYLPKVKQNYTVGIKLPWTLDDEENWEKTHRFAGRLWVLAGLVMCLGVLVFSNFLKLLMLVMLLILLFPVAYSYWLYQKKSR